MLQNRQPLSAEQQQSHLPMSGILRRRMKKLFGLLGLLLSTQVLIIWAVEDLTLFESLWLTMTTLVTVGYGDFAPQSVVGRFSTMALMFITAITLLSLIVSDFIEFRFYRRERMLIGRWIYNMKDHIVIINTPRHGGEQYFRRIVSQIRAVPGYEAIPIQLLTQEFPQGLPPELKDVGVTHYHGSGSDNQALRAVHADRARHILLLAADESDPASDSLTFDIAHRLSEAKLCSRLTLECVRDENRPRFQQLGVRTIIRPVRTYPEIMVRAVVSPGSEKVLEDLFNYQQDHPHRYEIALDDLSWSDIVCALVREGIGTALAYINHDGEVICHPEPAMEVEGQGLIVLVKSDETPSTEKLEEALARYRRFIEKWHEMQKQAGLDPAAGSTDQRQL